MPVAGNEGLAMFAATCAGQQNQQQPKGNMLNFESQKVIKTPDGANIFSKLGIS